MTGGRHVAALDLQLARAARRNWPEAFRAVRGLIADHDDTSQVFRIERALAGKIYARDYARLLATPQGGRLAYERVELAERLMDEAWYATFPPGSVGAAYLDFLRTEHLSMQGLLDESHKAIPPAELDARHPYVWMYRRIRDIHDILHILTGYGREPLGELCLLQFTFQETHELARGVLVMGGFLRARGPWASRARKAILEARRRSRRAAWILGEDPEHLLFEPLEGARQRLGLTPPMAYEAVPLAHRSLVEGAA
jgi:ubiquinone biosynthesis protein COQ4